MYNLTGKSFTSFLTELDPDDEYIDTPLEFTDAFERQLKRFNINTCGQNCSTVDKFFETSESAVLFPEYVRRIILEGMKMSRFGEIIAVYSKVNETVQSSIELDDSASYDSAVAQGAEIPATIIKASTSGISLAKYGRQIKTSYEFIRRQRLDIFAVLLRDIGKKFANRLFTLALNTAKGGITAVNTATPDISYTDLVGLFGQFTNYDMTTLVVSPANMAKIMVLDEVKDLKVTDDGRILLPFGVELIKFNGLSNTTLVALDKNFAMEMYSLGDILLETDKLISQQMDVISFSVNCAFKRINSDAIKTLNIISG